MPPRHGVPVRGLLDATHSRRFEGRFGRIFRNLPPASFGANDGATAANLAALARAMIVDEEPRDGPDDEESAIPTLYTYLGQFVDHDLTFDTTSSLQRANDPSALVDFRSPALDLDCIYGRGPDDQPYMYREHSRPAPSFLVGSRIEGTALGCRIEATDLARNSAEPARALIGDPRNDENVIVSQLQGLFHRFHDRVVAENPGASFARVQRAVRFHYQFVVLNDFLPRIVSHDVLAELRTHGLWDVSKLRFFRWRNEPFLPIEFSGAAYRLGHSMVRPGYRLNDDDATLLPVFPREGGTESLEGSRAMNPNFAIDWGRFIDVDERPFGTETEEEDGGGGRRGKVDLDNSRRLQLAYKIDTSVVGTLANLPASVASSGPRSLAERNLLRGFRLGLPSGQDVARAMGVRPLHDEEIVIGEDATPIVEAARAADAPHPEAFRGNCPLWIYVLAEAMQPSNTVKIRAPAIDSPKIDTPRLGAVGGRIVAETLVGLTFGDPQSYLRLDPLWTPRAGAEYALRDFVRYALGE